MAEQRRKYLVDKHLQWKLARRLLMTWLVGGGIILFFPLTLTMMYGFWLSPMSPSEFLADVADSIWLPLLTAALVIPMGLRDCIRFSNRIAGPMFRMRRDINRLLDGQHIAPVSLRKHDCFTDFADDFNRLTAEYQQMRQQLQNMQSPATIDVSLADDKNVADEKLVEATN